MGKGYSDLCVCLHPGSKHKESGQCIWLISEKERRVCCCSKFIKRKSQRYNCL